MKEVKLTQGMTAIVCDCHYDKVARFKWHYGTDGYALGQGTSMHRFIVGNIPKGYEVDHTNHNRLDNRCTNLKAVPLYHNRQRGIDTGLKKEGNRWGVQIARGGKRYWLGVFDTKEDARAEYQRASDQYHATGKITK